MEAAQNLLDSLGKRPRIDVIDALRGFAVMAIVLVHSVEHFIFSVYPENQPAWLAAIDQGVFAGIFALFAGKAYAIFALLFGFTFFLQSDNQKRKGKDFGYRFLWRMVLLLGFATLDAAFFPAGDVLLLFAVVGLVLFLVRKWSDSAVGVLAAIFLLQPMEWIYGIMSWLLPGFSLPDWGIAAMYDEVGNVVKEGDWLNMLWTNVTLGQKASLLWAVDAGRFFQTAGLFLLGMLIGRKGLFLMSQENLRFWGKVLILSAVAFSPLYAWKELLGNSDSASIVKTVGTVFDMWQKLAFTFVLVSSFVLAYYRSQSFGKLVSNLRYYGRMSLTNYVTQSIIGALIFFPVGFYLAPYCGYTLSLLVGMVIFGLQLTFCKWWLKKHRQGPLESLWHWWTWLGDASKKR